MILHLGPDTPFIIRAAATSALVLHIGGASLGLASGAVAMATRKGGRVHRASGNVFFVSMLTMAGIGAVVSPMLNDRVSAVMGVLTFYLTATAWAVVRRKPDRVGRFEVGAMATAIGVVVADIWLVRIGIASPDGMVDGLPYGIALVFGAVAALAAGLDLRMIRSGGVSGPSRIARHLWRMCLALFIAAGSFAGQPRAQPEAIRGASWLFLPALAVLVLMAFWLVRIRFTGRRAAARLATT
jgi:uncharacterized membrane protein